MAKTKISEFSATPGNNTDIDGINIAEGCAPSGINDAIRELMAQLKDFQAGTAGDSFNGPVGTTTAAAGAFTTLTTSGAVTHNGGTANGVAYLNGSKVLTTGSALTFDGTNLGVGGVPSVIFHTKQAGSTYHAVERTAAGSEGILYVGATSSSNQIISQGASSAAKDLTFQIGSSEQMRLTSTGLGIGTSSPYSKLTISSGASNDTRLLLQSNASGGAVNAGLMLGLIGSNGYVYNYANGPIIFGTNGADRATLDSSGNLGLGVTPSAWGSAYKALDLNTRGLSVAGGTESGALSVNAYWNSGWKYAGTSTYRVSQYQQFDGAHSWYTAPSGTAGNAISFTQSMTLDASGRLSVGTTGTQGLFTVYSASGTTPTAGDVGTASHATISGASRNGTSSYGGVFANTLTLQSNEDIFSSGSGASIGFQGKWNSSLYTSAATFASIFGGKENGTSSNYAGYLSFATRPDGGSPTERARITSGGEVYIAGTTDQGAYNLQVNGTGVWAAGAYVNGSDARLKENVQTLTDGLSVVTQLRPVTFQYKAEYSKDTAVQPGFIAQELKQVLEGKDYVDGVVQAGPEYLNVAYQSLIPVLTAAIQELKAELDSVKTELATLKGN